MIYFKNFKKYYSIQASIILISKVYQDADKLQKFKKKNTPIRGYEQTENPNFNSHNNFLVHTPPRIRIKHHRPQLCIFKSLINTLTVHHHTSLSSSLTLH